jgi:prolyl-tRNA editing enzyme YbaK/EbsC (Cys-tRNA(Pro) deacylase)
MKGALDLHQGLLAADVPHQILRLRRLTLIAAEIPAALGVDPASCLVVHVVTVTRQGNSTTAALVLPVGAELHVPSTLRRLQASSLRLLTPTEVSAVTEFYAGLVPPVGLPAGMPVYADHAVIRFDVVYCPTGDSGAVLGIHSRDLVTFTGARLAALCSAPVAGRGSAEDPDPDLAAAT